MPVSLLGVGAVKENGLETTESLWEDEEESGWFRFLKGLVSPDTMLRIMNRKSGFVDCRRINLFLNQLKNFVLVESGVLDGMGSWGRGV